MKSLWILGGPHRQNRQKTIDKLTQMSRTIEESHRPQVSDRTMRCHSFSGQQSGLLSQKTIGAVTRTEMESQRRAVLVRTAGAAKTTLATMRGGANSWAECRPNSIGIEFSGEIFLLTFPFIGLVRTRLPLGTGSECHPAKTRASGGCPPHDPDPAR